MANIPGKQLHRTGTTAELRSYLSNREFGYSTEEKRAYTKIAGELVPLADDKFVVFGATFTPSSGTYRWPPAPASTWKIISPLTTWIKSRNANARKFQILSTSTRKQPSVTFNEVQNGDSRNEND